MTSNRVDQASLQKAQGILCANLPPRYFVLDQLERYVLGTQYAHLAPWKREDLPLFERAPCVQYPIVQRSIDSNADLCLGEGRWPLITSNPGEDDTAFDERLGLDEEQSEILDRAIKAISEQARLRSVSSELLCEAQGCKTAVAVCCIRDGKLYVESVKAKHCSVTFVAGRANEVERLEVKYPYVEEWFNPEHKRWEARVLLYRRVIDALADKTYKPVIANEDGADINDHVWQALTTIEHALGFCPVIWYRFMPKTSDAGNADGVAVHEQIKDEIDGLNYALSMRHRAALCAGDPQIVETGVDDGDMNAPMGRQAQSIAQPGDHASMGQWQNADVRGQSGMNMPARKRGCGVIWSTPNPQAKVEYLTLPGDALKVLEDDAADLLNLLREALAFVSIDPADAKLGIGELSGKALEWFHKKQTDRCTKIREDFGHSCLLPLVNMLLRMVHAKGADKSAALFLPGLAKVLPVLAKFEQAYGAIANENGAPKRWFPPYLKLAWGPFFSATAADAKADIEMTILAMDAGLITLETAVKKIAPHFPSIEDAAQYIEALKKEKAEKMSEVHDAQTALNGAGEEGAGEDDEQEPPSEKPAPMMPAKTPPKPAKRIRASA